MKSIAIVLVSVMLTSAAALAQAPADPSQVIVTGEGSVKATPDQAWITVGAESRAKVAKEAQQRNAEAMTAVQQKIAAFGVPKDAVRTTAIDLQVEFDYANGKQTPRGYVARHTIDVRVDDLSKLGDVLDAVVGSGATTIHGLRFDVKQREQFELSALQAGVKQAMAKAQALALGAGRAVDRVIRIEESFAGQDGPRPIMMERAFAKADASTPVAAGELEIRALVRLTVSMK
ncbi:MAG: SIMPL domain-containing protein [Vicinamibacterales bacterium]